MTWNTRKYKDGLYFLNKNDMVEREPLQDKSYPVMWWNSLTAIKHDYDVRALVVNCPWNDRYVTIVKGGLAWISIR